jgi:hypothetical protein
VTRRSAAATGLDDRFRLAADIGLAGGIFADENNRQSRRQAPLGDKPARFGAYGGPQLGSNRLAVDDPGHSALVDVRYDVILNQLLNKNDYQKEYYGRNINAAQIR